MPIAGLTVIQGKCRVSATFQSPARVTQATQGLALCASLRLARVLGELESNHNPCREEVLSVSKHRILIAIGVIVATIVGAAIVTGQGSSACVTGGAVPANNAALAADCDTLLGMKSALRGSGKLNWWTGRSIDKWDGITLGSGRVVQVSLPSKSLDGIIPAGFGNLPALQVLDLSSNSLTGTIPSELGNLTNLTRWRLSGNSLTGCVPGQPVAGGR